MLGTVIMFSWTPSTLILTRALISLIMRMFLVLTTELWGLIWNWHYGICLVVKLEIGVETEERLLWEEFRYRLITYSAKMKKEKRERDSKGTGKNQTDRPADCKETTACVCNAGRRERSFPLERAPPLRWGAQEQALTFAGQHHAAFLWFRTHLLTVLSRLWPWRGPGTHSLWFHQVYSVPGAYINFNHANNPVRLDISA